MAGRAEASRGGRSVELAQENALSLSSSSWGSGLSSILGLSPSWKEERELTFVDFRAAIKRIRRTQGFTLLTLQDFHTCTL